MSNPQGSADNSVCIYRPWSVIQTFLYNSEKLVCILSFLTKVCIMIMVVHLNHIVKLSWTVKANYKILYYKSHKMYAYLSLKIPFSSFFMEYHCQPQ